MHLPKKLKKIKRKKFWGKLTPPQKNLRNKMRGKEPHTNKKNGGGKLTNPPKILRNRIGGGRLKPPPNKWDRL